MGEIIILNGIESTLFNVIKSFVPVLLLFLIFQFLFLKLPSRSVINQLTGILISIAGLTLFLQGVRVGFMPVGIIMGEILGKIEHKWTLIPLGFLLGFLSTLSEPAVRILSSQVEDASAGFIKKWLVLYTISIGVGILISVGMIKIIYGISLFIILIPAYIISIILIWFTERDFVAIAFDAGGVATGPMAVTFLLSIAVGITSVMEGRNPISDAFGLVSLIALAPILSIMLLGLIFKRKQKKIGV